MSLPRRTFLRGSVLAAGSALFLAPNTFAAPASLRPTAFRRLPPGAVTPGGWLATQLDHQLHGLNGRYQEISHFLQFDNTGWTRPDRDGGEEVPYWLRGYGDLGYVTGDSRVLADTERWINAVIATQAADGYFGPAGLRTGTLGHAELWPHMPMTHALRSWAEYHNDTRVDDMLARYFRFVAQQPDAVFTDGWGNTRWGDTIDVLYWLHGRSGDQSLLDLAGRIHQHSADWSGIASLHNVNFAQGFREPAQFWLLSGDGSHLASSYRTYDTMMATYGQFPGGGFAGDENARPGYNDPRQGFETCGIVEFMASHELLTRITGDPVWADRTEDLAFNMLPAALDPRGVGVHYVTSANSVWLDDVPKSGRQFDDAFALQAFKPGVDKYRCCPHNYGQGWPYYVEEMWHTTPDGGVVATLYGPCTLKIPGLTVSEQTAYPFSDTITFSFSLPAPKAFSFTVRIPGWCDSPQLTVNGAAVGAGAGPRFATVTRTWSAGDTVELRLPKALRTRTWNHQAVSVDYGPLTFSLQIGEQWNQYGGTADWPEYEVKPTTAWNVGLTPNPGFTVTFAGDMSDPFANPPVRITAQAQDIPDWTTDSENVIAPLSDGPVATTGGTRTVQLIPMGAARLRLTTFPRTGGTTPWGTPGAVVKFQNRNSGKVLGIDQMSTADSAMVVQFADTGTDDHRWRLVDLGNGWMKIRNERSGKVLGVDQMSTANSAQVVQFADTGTRDHRWQLVDNGDGWFRLRNNNSGKVLGVDQMSTADSARVVQYDDTGTADHLWRIIPDGWFRIQNLNSTKVLGVDQMSTADSARVVQFADSGTDDHLWEFVADVAGSVRIRNIHSGKVLGVDRMSTADSAQVVQFADSGTPDHRWQLRPDANNLWRVWNVNSGKVLGVDRMLYTDSANVVQFGDTGTPDHLWRLLPSAPGGTPGAVVRIQNINSRKVLGVDGMSTANSAMAVQFEDSGTPDHRWRFVDLGNGWMKIRNENSGKLLGVDKMSTANSAQVVQFEDTGTEDHLWQVVDVGDGWFRLRNKNSGKILGVDRMSTANSARVVQFDDNGTLDHLWRMIPDGRVKIQNLNSGKVLGVDQMSTADSAQVVQFTDSGTEDHLWEFVPDAAATVRIRNVHSGKLLGVDKMSTASSARVVQFADNGTADHFWELRPDANNSWRIWNVNSSKVLGVDQMSTADSAAVVQFGDTGTADHRWRLLSS